MLETIKAIVADMDGVLWRGDTALPGAAAFFQHIQGKLPYVFATNNSTKTVETYIQKLSRFGIPAQPEQIITSAVATASYLAKEYTDGATVYAVGEHGIQYELQSRGFRLIAGREQPPALVVVGLSRQFTYETLHNAIHHIRNGARFIGTNADTTFPIPEGFAPGAGSIIAAIEAGAGVIPEIIGKPAAPMFQIALSRLGISAAQTLMIGDRLETDIQGAAALGMKTALVLSGVASETDIIHSTVQPNVVYRDLEALLGDIVV